MNILISFLIALLMGLGIGGGGLFIIFLTQWLNFDQITAQGTNLAFFFLCALASLFVHVKKRKIYPVQVIVMIIFGVIGSYIFSHYANMIDPEIPKKVLGGVLIVGATMTFVSLFNKNKNKN
ncbi:MAG: sulfite exporter TauE/SafE family protein [Clostridia bacterium]|nr:sulfite exporter TauE/SafE family protein [Clostridia bacterium]